MRQITLIVVSILFSTFSISGHSTEIAECSNPSGKAYYAEIGIVSKKGSGWEQNEKITGGIVKLSKIGQDKYDILFVDATKRIISSVEDGGKLSCYQEGKILLLF